MRTTIRTTLWRYGHLAAWVAICGIPMAELALADRRWALLSYYAGSLAVVVSTALVTVWYPALTDLPEWQEHREAQVRAERALIDLDRQRLLRAADIALLEHHPLLTLQPPGSSRQDQDGQAMFQRADEEEQS